jgi:sugar-specific transcriptional regulator TrmB
MLGFWHYPNDSFFWYTDRVVWRNMTSVMDEYAALRELGLKDVEVKVYTALLSSGPTSIRAVATAAKVNRGTTYEALKSLAEAGLVAYTRKGERNKYRAESPERIYDLIQEKRQMLTQIEADARNLVPSLLALGRHGLGSPAVRFYEDDEGIVVILRDVLQTVSQLPRREYYAYSSRTLRKYLYRRFPNFTRRRIADGVSVRVIAVGEGGEPDENSQRRWIPEPPASELSSYMLIYGNKLALISVSADDTPYGVVIEEPGVAAMQRLLFDTLWSRLG